MKMPKDSIFQARLKSSGSLCSAATVLWYIYVNQCFSKKYVIFFAMKLQGLVYHAMQYYQVCVKNCKSVKMLNDLSIL